MPLIRIKIENFKSIKHCDISLSELNLFLGENGTGKTSILEAIYYFYQNLTEANINDSIFDENNRFSNEARITLYFDFSEFVKISKSNSDDSYIFDDQPSAKIKYGGYYKTIISIAAKSKDRIIPVCMSQIKGKPIRWNYSYEDRFIFKSLFPIFYVDTRTLDVTEWGYVWDILGELGKVSNDERKVIEAKISNILIDESKEISKKLKGISDIFSAADVSIEPAKSKDFAKILSKIYFSGATIHQKGKKLGYYSTGTNSVKYIELLLRAIYEIASAKLKEPIVLFDEPEISLHPLFMDELSESVIDVITKLRILISTHSARLTKNLLVGTELIALYNVKLLNKYTHIQHMKKFSQYSPSSKYRVTDDHINSYFSRAILFVEGETELELFSNPYLKLLYPKLRYVDIFKAMSEAPILNIMNPKLAQTNIPYICLIDMDKAISYNKDSKRFELKGEYIKKNDKERFLYRNKHEEIPYLYHLRKRIEEMETSLRIHYYKPYFSCEDSNYYAFIEAIHDYLMFYNVFALNTTIEGCLINKYTVDFALEYLHQHKSEKDFNPFNVYVSGLLTTDKVNALRIVYNGKSDLLFGHKQLKKTIPTTDYSVIEKIMIGKKTSGWVSDYLDTYFQTISRSSSDFSVKAFKKYLDVDEQRKFVVKDFSHDFPELDSLISKICDMIN